MLVVLQAQRDYISCWFSYNYTFWKLHVILTLSISRTRRDLIFYVNLRKVKASNIEISFALTSACCRSELNLKLEIGFSHRHRTDLFSVFPAKSLIFHDLMFLICSVQSLFFLMLNWSCWMLENFNFPHSALIPSPYSIWNENSFLIQGSLGFCVFAKSN